MAKIVKVIEVMSESPNSWEEATQNVASEASKTLRNIRSIYVKEFNLSAHGPIIPLDARVLALTPISAFRPRRWRGALLAHTAKVTFEMEK